MSKVTALLLATSMVLSSVSVGTFADELVFEDEYSVTADAGEDEAYFGDEVVEEEVVEDNGVEDEAFFDEVIEDDAVAEDEHIEDSVTEGEAFAEEVVVDNSDVFEAIASDDVSYDISGDMSYTGTYDGQAHGLDASKASVGASNVQFNLTPDADNPTWSSASRTYKHVTYNSGNAAAKQEVYRYRQSETGAWSDPVTADTKAQIKINKKGLTITLKDQTYKVGDTAPTLTVDMFTFDGLVSGETASQKFTITDTSLKSASSKWGVKKWDGAAWPSSASEMTTLVDSATGKFIGAPGRYQIVLASGNTASDEFSETILTDDGQEGPDYNVTYVAGVFTIEASSEKEITVTWPDDLTFNGEAQTYEPVLAGYKFTPAAGTTNTGTDAGTYTYTIGTVTKTSDSTTNYKVTNPTHEWKINKYKAYALAGWEADSKTFEYGIADPTATLSKTSIKFFDKKANGTELAGNLLPSSNDITGTAKFATTYSQFDPVYTWNGSTNTEIVYAVKYDSGLEHKNFEILAADPENTTPPTDFTSKFILTPGYVKVVPDNITAKYGDEPKTPTYKIEDTNKDSNAAKGLENAISANKVVLDVYTVTSAGSTVKVTPTEAGKTYYYASKVSDKVAGSHEIWNWQLTSPSSTEGVGYLPTDDAKTYKVNEGSFDLKFEDTTVTYDGKAHGIKTDPETLPSYVTVYWSNYAMKAPTEGTIPECAESTTPADLYLKAEPLQYTDAGVYTIYYYVVSTGVGGGMNGSKKLTIKSVDEAAADEVEKQIEEAVKPDAAGNLDADKIKAAREAYDALTEDQKKLVDPYDVKALKDAEAAVKDQTDEKAAKAVEDLIDKLPAADKATAADKEAADAAKDAYDKLTDAQKKLVPADKVKKMNDVKAAADKAAEDADKKAAKAVEEEIAALPAAADAKASDKAAADKAKADYDALTDAQKALVPAEAVEKLDAVKKAADEAAEKEEEAKKEVAAFDEKVAAVKAAKNGVDGKAAAEDAKAAYDALSDEAKALLTDEEKAAYEATQEAYKKDKTFNSGEGVFRVLSNGEVTFLKPLHPENTWFVVPNQVKKNGFNYRVVKVSTKAFMGCTKATKIKIGKNVQSMGAYAFKNTPVMTKLIFLTSKLGSGKVTNTFGGAGKSGGAKLTVVVPSGKTGSYEKLFKGEGGLNSSAKFTEED